MKRIRTLHLVALANPLYLLFADAAQGPIDCFFCTADWLLKLVGFEPSFSMLHHYELAGMNMNQVMAREGDRVASQVYLPVKSRP